MADTNTYDSFQKVEKWTTRDKFNALDLSTIETGTEYNLAGAIEESDLDSDLQTKINEVSNKLTAPTTPTAESAVTMLADGTVGTKPLSEIGGGGGSSVTVDSALSSTSENPVQNKVITSALNGKYEKPSGGIPKTDLASNVQTSLEKADTALQTHQTITTGSVNGTIAANGTNVAVKGLKALAYKDSLTKTDVGLGNVDNTSDEEKPISTATQAALDKKQASLTATQLNAVNSGITSSKVSTYDGYSTSKQDKLTAGTNITLSGSTISAANPSSNIKIYKLEQNLSISPSSEMTFSNLVYTMSAGRKYHIDLYTDCSTADGSSIMSAQIKIKRGPEVLLDNVCRTTLHSGGGVMCSLSYDNTSGDGTERIYPSSYNYTNSNKSIRASLYIMEIL